MIEQTPEQAMRFVKDFVRSIAPADLLDAQAFRLMGEPPERVEKILPDIREQVARHEGQ